MELRDKRILITGVAKGGIGESFMEKCLQQENTVLISSKNMSADRFLNVLNYQADCTQEKDVNQLSEFVVKELGGLDVLVNCIGGSLKSLSPLDISQEFFERVIAVNLTSAFLLTQMAARLMNSGGSIVHIVSSSAFEPEISKMPYAISKAGLVHLIRSMAMALAPQNIRINGVSPTYVFTRRHERELKIEAENMDIPLKETIEKKTRKQLLVEPLLPIDLVKMIEFAATTKVMTGKILHATLGRII